MEGNSQSSEDEEEDDEEEDEKNETDGLEPGEFQDRDSVTTSSRAINCCSSSYFPVLSFAFADQQFQCAFTFHIFFQDRLQPLKINA